MISVNPPRGRVGSATVNFLGTIDVVGAKPERFRGNLAGCSDGLVDHSRRKF